VAALDGTLDNVIQTRITMSASTSIRDLRNHFPKVRKLLEAEGEVLLTEKGKPRYRLTAYSPPGSGKPQPIDYWKRLRSYQPRSLTRPQSQALRDDNRGDR
jgi:antitoxin (DNA-binding transcriptional repressor) of toxin-antitoxin stability system